MDVQRKQQARRAVSQVVEPDVGKFRICQDSFETVKQVSRVNPRRENKPISCQREPATSLS